MALVLLASAGLFAVAWGLQRDGVEPLDADGETPSASAGSDPASAPAGAGGATAGHGGPPGRPGPAPIIADPGGSRAVTGTYGDPATESDAGPGEDGPGSGGSTTDASPDPEAGSGPAADDGQATDGAASAVVDDSETDAPGDRPVAPLTGEPTSDLTLAQRRVLAVKVDNGDRRARPQAGLAAADVVYETLIEGGKTRLMAVFHSEMPSRVGPVRSVRSSDIELLADLSVPYLASSGANITVLREMRRAERAGIFVDVGGLRTFVPYWRDRSRRSPFNLYFQYENLVDEDAEPPGGSLVEPVAPLFDYGSNDSPGIAGAVGVTVTYHRGFGNVISHIWDAAAGGWVRIQEGELMTAKTDLGVTEIAPVNVAVVWMPHRASAATTESPQALSYGTGDALVLTAGTVHNAVWERTEDRAGFRFADEAGNPLGLSPGSTWVLIANSSRRYPVTAAEVVTASAGTRLLADARATALTTGNGALGL